MIDISRVFKPKLIDTLRDYSWSKFGRDALAGLIVGIVALPLAIALAIASGVSPERGLITAIVAGFLISVCGGSRVQIGGPTGAFIVIVYGIVQQHGVEGLIIATFLAGFMLIAMGLFRLGSVIKYMPYSLIIGFTSGIAVIIFSSQVKDFFGLEMGAVPADFVGKWTAFIAHFHTINVYASIIAAATIAIIFLWPRVSRKLPGSLVAIVATTAVVHFFDVPVQTIGSEFGAIAASIPLPEVPGINFTIIQEMIPAAFTIAMLGAIESLLSAVVADGMIGGNHRSNTELIGQGIGNIGSALFGGIPATGAIARTATNVRNHGRSPIAGIVHALVLLIILIFLGRLASFIPLSCLAGVLVVIAFNMSEYRNFISVLKGPRGDIAVMLATFLLTIFVGLTIAIEVGVIMAAFSFTIKMIQSSSVQSGGGVDDDSQLDDELAADGLRLPDTASVFEVYGPMFFGAAYKVREAVRHLEKRPAVLILRMRHVPVIDATGISSLQDVVAELKRRKIAIVLSELADGQVKTQLRNAGVLRAIGPENVCATLAQAVARAHSFDVAAQPS